MTAALVVGALTAAAPVAAHLLPRDAYQTAPAPAAAPPQPAAAASAQPAHPAPLEATGRSRNRERAQAALRLADGTRIGRVQFTATRGDTRVSATLRLPRRLAAAEGSFHGFHVHANDNPANGTGCTADPAAPASTWFVSADGHYTDPGNTHGEHRGDLPMVYLQRDGRARATFVTDRFRPADIVGRAVIVHAKPDNYGNVPVGTATNQYTPNSAAATALTATTGNASDRVVCGVVTRPPHRRLGRSAVLRPTKGVRTLDAFPRWLSAAGPGRARPRSR